MLRYTLSDYKKEMLEYTGKMPSTWIATYLSENCSHLSDTEKRKVKFALVNVFQGSSFKIGLTKGYINLIRKIYASHNNVPYKPLPKNIVTMEEIKEI